MKTKLPGILIFVGLMASCAVHDGGGCPGRLVKKDEPTLIMDRQVVLLEITDDLAKVRVGRSRKIHELELGHEVPVSPTLGLVLCSANSRNATAHISYFKISRTLELFPAF